MQWAFIVRYNASGEWIKGKMMWQWLRPPDEDRAMTAAGLVICCGLAAWTSTNPKILNAASWLALAATMLVAAAGLWRAHRWADYLAFLIALALLVAAGYYTALQGFNWKRGILIALFAWYTWENCKLVLQPPRGRDDAVDDDDAREMTSLVLLLAEPRYLEAPVLANILESAWGHPFKVHERREDDEDGGSEEGGEPAVWSVIGESPMFIVMTDSAFYMVHNHDQQYFDDVEGMVEQLSELRVRKMLEEHTAWLSMDVLQSLDEQRPAESFYPEIGLAIAELAEAGQVLGIIHPATQRWNPWDDALLEQLRGDDPLAAVGQYPNVPVIQIESDDPRMQAAVAEARQRWPEFVAAYNARDEEQKFTVKAAVTRNDNTEFIWLDVFGLEPKYIHGTLANDPVNLGGLQLGDRVEVPLTDLNDWAYTRPDGEFVGLFTVQVIHEIQAARSPNTQS